MFAWSWRVDIQTFVNNNSTTTNIAILSWNIMYLLLLINLIKIQLIFRGLNLIDSWKKRYLATTVLYKQNISNTIIGYSIYLLSNKSIKANKMLRYKDLNNLWNTIGIFKWIVSCYTMGTRVKFSNVIMTMSLSNPKRQHIQHFSLFSVLNNWTFSKIALLCFHTFEHLR